MKREGVAYDVYLEQLLENLSLRIDQSIELLKVVNENQLTDVREVGRGRIPSTAIGLYVHAAEHTMRHTGQLLATVAVIKAGERGV